MDLRNLPLLPCGYYHIYNCAVGSENIFRKKENYYFFLDKVSNYILPVCDILSYCLLPNHFHFFIHVKEEEQLKTFAKEVRKEKKEVSEIVSEQFANCFNSYTKSFNKVFNRTGKLFDLPFKRIEVISEAYYTILIIYIHRNPVHHGFVKRFDEWEFSSYKAFLSNAPTKLARNEVLNWFGNVDLFIKAHAGNLEDFNQQLLFLE
jgi:REP element-mobilizing transposase RayT